MFAYCGNNPIRFIDKTGTAAIDPICMDCMDFPGNGTGARLQINYCTTFARRIDKLIFDFIEIKSIEDCINWYNDYKDFEEIANPIAGIRTIKGLHDVYKALEILSAPISGVRGWFTMGKYAIRGLWTFNSSLAELTD